MKHLLTLTLILFATISTAAQSGYYDRMERAMSGEDIKSRTGLCGRCIELGEYVNEDVAATRAFDYLVEQERWRARGIGWMVLAGAGVYLANDGSEAGGAVLVVAGAGLSIDGLATWIRGRKILKGNF